MGVSVEKVGEIVLRRVKFGNFFKIFYPAVAQYSKQSRKRGVKFLGFKIALKPRKIGLLAAYILAVCVVSSAR